MFDPNDLYVASGSAELVNTWQATVTKFDTSSFYNWEQDNLPIYDLEDRTDYLWSKSGYPTSTIPGVTLVVSSTATASGNVFNTLQDAIDVLPDVIRYPILIEVAASGDLGELNLDNIKVEGDGAGLEIVNRLYAKSMYDPSSDGTVSSVTDNYIEQFSSSALSATIEETSAISVSALPEWNLDNFNVSLFGVPELTSNGARLKKISFSKDQSFIGSNYNFTLASGLGSDLTEGTYDVSVLHGVTESQIGRADTAVSDRVIGVVYGNSLSGLNISNCDKEVYVRGFVVDGGDTHDVETGITVTNSNVLLENMAAIRCKQDGLEVRNSRVILNRGFTAFRNYELSSTPSERINRNSAGLNAINSEIIFSATTESEKGLPYDANFWFADNEFGIKAFNSVFKGGSARGNYVDGSAGGFASNYVASQHILNISCRGNTDTGLCLATCTWDSDARLSVFEHFVGVHLKNTLMEIPEASIDFNQHEGILAEDSTITYNKNLVPLSGTISDSYRSQLRFDHNGQHLVMYGSRLNHPKGDGLDQLFGEFYAASSHGANNIDLVYNSTPSIEAKNSELSFVGLRLLTEGAEGGNFASTYNYGSAFKLTQSELELRGIKGFATMILGPNHISNQKHNAGIYAEEGSKVRVQGPTTIGQFGIDILADKGSLAVFEPLGYDGNVDVSAWGLADTDNHTKVQLHSTRACVVADNGSTIEFVDCGDVHEQWPISIASALLNDGNDPIGDYNAIDDYGTSAYTLSGYVQFFPNFQDVEDLVYGAAAFSHDLSAETTLTAKTFTELVDWDGATPQDDYLDYSWGGVCVRALNSSNVKVRNVHFPTGWHNASGISYDISGANCNRLYIWNIANDSNLDVAFASVSGTFPSEAGYHGPSAVYTSGSGDVAYGAPSSTPDTSSLSVLDSFGQGGPYGKSTWENQGAFRLFVSPVGPAKMVGYVSGTEVLEGTIYQQVAQGYNPSGDVSAANPSDLSGLYEELESSGFLYGSALTVPSNDRIRLDESGANLFSNAKHMAQGKSGLNKLVTIYRSITQPTGEGYDADKVAKAGIGFISANTFDLKRQN